MELDRNNQISEFLSALDAPAFFVKDGEILCVNPSAEQLSVHEGAAEELLAALDPAKTHVISLNLCGSRRTVSCKSYQGGLLCQIVQEPGATVSADYLNIISGEIRKPLGELMMALEQLYPSLPESGEAEHCAAQAQRNVYRLLRLASQLNAGSSVKQGAWQLHLQRTELRAWLDEIALQAENLFDYSQAGFRYSGLTAPFVGCVDLEKLERSIWNLLSNALLHAPKGSLVQMESRRSGSQLILTVRNEADGEQETLRGSVFSYDTERTGLESGKNGLGFGLSLVRACAELHGGSVLLSTQKEGGTAVAVSIPVAEAGEEVHNSGLIFDEYGGLHHGLLELSEALDPEAFL